MNIVLIGTHSWGDHNISSYIGCFAAFWGHLQYRMMDYRECAECKKSSHQGISWLIESMVCWNTADMQNNFG